MFTDTDITKWTPTNVINWLTKLKSDPSWINIDYIKNENVNGAKLLLMTAQDLTFIGASKIDLQEHILEEIEKLKLGDVTKETLQIALLRLSCLSRSLQKQLVAERETKTRNSLASSPKEITLSRDFIDVGKPKQEQRVSLDTLSLVSAIVKNVCRITEGLKQMATSKQGEFRSIKSLLLVLSLELTSTAQRDQFVERPNDIIEKSSKALADYCDKIVQCDDIYLT